MKYLLIITLFFGISACKKDEVKPEMLQKTWNFGYKTKQKDKNGNFGHWATINTLVAVQPIAFKPNGEFWVENKKATGCCSCGRYKLTKKIITYYEPFNDGDNCGLYDCSSCSTNKVIFINKDSLFLQNANTINLWLAQK